MTMTPYEALETVTNSIKYSLGYGDKNVELRNTDEILEALAVLRDALEWHDVNIDPPEVGTRYMVRYLYSVHGSEPTTKWISGGHIDSCTKEWVVDSQCQLSSFKVSHYMKLPTPTEG